MQSKFETESEQFFYQIVTSYASDYMTQTLTPSKFEMESERCFPQIVKSRGEGVLLGILGGDVPPGSPSPDPISDQKMSFFTPVFRPCLLKHYVIITQIRIVTKKISQKSLRTCIFFFLSYSFGIEFRNTFIHSRISLKVIPDSRTKWEQSISVFRPKQCKTPTLWGGTSLNFMGLLQVVITPSVISESTSC